MGSIPLFAARPLTPVAALFRDSDQAFTAAEHLRQQQTLQDENISVLRPDDLDVAYRMRRMQPDGQEPATWRLDPTWVIRAAAVVAGLAAAVISGWLWVAASSGLSLVAAMALGIAIALGLAGLLNWSPDERQVVSEVEQALRDGHWAVVAHSSDPRTAFAASDSLRRHGGEVLRAV